MQSTGLDLVLDDDAGGLARLLSIGAGVAVLALLVAMTLPIAVLGVMVAQPQPSGAVNGQEIAPGQLGAPAGVLLPSVNPAAEVAHRYLGVPYVFGGTDPTFGLDCSGLVQLVYQQLGIRLPRTAQQQYAATQRISDDQLQPGDLVFFERTYADPNDWVTHVGIYIGRGQQINAPTTGRVVSIQPVFSGFWGAHYVGGGRVQS